MQPISYKDKLVYTVSSNSVLIPFMVVADFPTAEEYCINRGWHLAFPYRELGTKGLIARWIKGHKYIDINETPLLTRINEQEQTDLFS